MADERNVALGVALLAGALGAVQPKLNAVLGDRVGSALIASLVNFLVALGCVAIALRVRPETWRRVRDLRSWSVPVWVFTAGLGGAIVVLAGAITVETIGVALFSVAFFSGQIAFGLVVDKLGVGPGGRRPVTRARLLAVVLAIVAVGVAQIGREPGEFAPLMVAFVVASGAGVALQSAFNAKISAVTGDPVAATAVNVAVGTVALSVVMVAVAATGGIGWPQWPREPWLYVGGALGVTIVLSLAIASSALGVLQATIAMLSVQLISGFVVDAVIAGDAPTPGVVMGGVLIVGAVALVGRRPAPVVAPPVGET
jgi:bacterial/archaeal transporter family-2 protein